MDTKALVAIILFVSLSQSALVPALASVRAAPILTAVKEPHLAPSAVQSEVAAGGAWTLLGSQPPGRDAPSWVYDLREDRFILFGGGLTGTTATNSTWSYDYTNNTWANITPVVGPSPRASASMVYDSRADRVILFGGSPAPPASLGDTWIFDYANRTWTNVTSSTHPATRAFAAMAYDPVSDRTILFGGIGGAFGSVLYADTWALDYATRTWTPRNPTGSPTGRFGSTMSYDATNQTLLEFGGAGLSGTSIVFFNDLYSYAYGPNAWTRLQPALSPPGRAAGAMGYDVSAQRLVVFGGTSGLFASSNRNDTWAYDPVANSWANVTPAHSPTPRADTVMDFDLKAGLFVLFGGASITGTPLDDAWSYRYGPAVPTAPLGLAAVAGTLQVTLTWQAPASNGGSPVVNYSIYRGTSSGGETLLKNVGPILTYTDTAVTAGITYYYEVSASNIAGEGPKSNEASATPTGPPTAPSAPRSLAAAAGNAKVTLTWVAPASDGGAAITGYKVYRGTVSGSETLVATLSVVLTYDDSTATNGQTYYYVVTAMNSAGESPKSNEASATPTAPPDTTSPSVAITSPANGSTLTSAMLTVTGTASDDVAVQKVEVSTDGMTWSLASGTSAWSGSLTLASGTNTIYARATDTSGNQATTHITVTVNLQGAPVAGPQGVSLEVLVALVVVVAAVAGLAVFLMRRRREKEPTQAIPPPPPPPPPP